MTDIDQPIRMPIPVKHAKRAYSPVAPLRQAVDNRLYVIFKRLVDIGSAILGGVMVLAFCPLIWLANQLTSPGSLFYYQERVGQHGKLFRMVKFRSMVMRAEADTGPVWVQPNDSRITPVGRLLRKSHLDELPQVWNVLRGEMSLVGPRPERPEFVASLAESIPEFSARHAVKPGITGWAQVNYRYVNSVDETRIKLHHDLEYIAHQGIWLDLIILLRTVEAVVKMQGQ